MICRAGEAAADGAAAAAAGVEVKQEDAQAGHAAEPAPAGEAAVPADQQMAEAGAGAGLAVQIPDGQEAEVRQEGEQQQEREADQRDRERGGDRDRERGGRGGGSGGQAQGVDLGSFKLPADALLKQDIPLPRRMASCVIGIKGQSVSKLRRESGAKIHVRPAQGRDEMDQVVEIEGSIESVSAGVVFLWAGGGGAPWLELEALA